MIYAKSKLNSAGTLGLSLALAAMALASTGCAKPRGVRPVPPSAVPGAVPNPKVAPETIPQAEQAITSLYQLSGAQLAEVQALMATYKCGTRDYDDSGAPVTSDCTITLSIGVNPANPATTAVLADYENDDFSSLQVALETTPGATPGEYIFTSAPKQMNSLYTPQLSVLRLDLGSQVNPTQYARILDMNGEDLVSFNTKAWSKQ
jgi:hypothetical protein